MDPDYDITITGTAFRGTKELRGLLTLKDVNMQLIG